MKTHFLRSEIWLPRPIEEVFEFFSNAENLSVITPPWVSFRIETPCPIQMRAGAIIDYRIGVHGIPLSWRTEITEWEPTRRFVDVQRRGPYRYWRHTHEFEPHERGTLCRDVVEYAVHLDFLVHELFVRKDVAAIFAFREKKLRELFANPGVETRF